MLFHAILKVLATASALLISSSGVRAAPLSSLQARDAFSVTVNPGFGATDEKVVYPLTNLAPVTASTTGYDKVHFIPTVTSGRYMVTAPDINTCVVWKDNAMAFGPCAGEGENVSFAVLCSDKPGTAADNKVCAFFLGEPTEKKCVAPDGDKVKLATDCDSANMQASQLWEVRPAPAKPAA